MGLINRFTDSAPDLKHAMVAWQGLLKKANAFLWGEDHKKALATVKEIITNPKGPIRSGVTNSINDRCFADGNWILFGPNRGGQQGPAPDHSRIPLP